MVFASSISSSAAELENAETAQIKTEHYEKVMSGQVETLPTEIGETKTVYQDENGTMTVTLVETDDSNYELGRAAQETKHTFVYNYTSFGVTREAFRVILNCQWYNNGVNSYILNLVGTCIIKDSSFSYYWDSDFYRTDAYCARYLNILHGGSSTFYIFSASLVPSSQPYITFAGTPY